MMILIANQGLTPANVIKYKNPQPPEVYDGDCGFDLQLIDNYLSRQELISIGLSFRLGILFTMLESLF
jgi:hypothetical protein